MTAQIYALIKDGVVQQVLSTEQDISKMFAAGLRWVAVGSHDVAPGYHYDGSNFVAPEPPEAPVGAAVGGGLAELQAQVAALHGAVSALSVNH
jgi:hypothetical protein